MFEESLLESAHRLQPRSRWPAVASFTLQAVIGAAIIVIPLMRPAALTLHAPLLTLTTPAPPPPPPVHRVRVETTTTVATTVPTPPAAPTRPIIQTIDPTGFRNEPPTIGSISMTGAGPTLDPALISSSSSTHTVIVTKPASIGPVRISQGVSLGLLLAPIRPTYPPLAKLTRTEGTVTIHAIISKTGAIESASVISGPAPLQAAALEAVRNARYQPYRLNGEPTEVETTFNINFRLNG